MRDFVAVEEKTKREPEIENVHIAEFDAKAGESPVKIIAQLAA